MRARRSTCRQPRRDAADTGGARRQRARRPPPDPRRERVAPRRRRRSGAPPSTPPASRTTLAVLALLSKYSERTYSLRSASPLRPQPEGLVCLRGRELAHGPRRRSTRRAAACAQLWDAAFAGDEAEVARLIEKGVDDLDWRRADARYYRGWTPLFAAVSAGSADCARFLLRALADVDCVTECRQHAAHRGGGARPRRDRRDAPAGGRRDTAEPADRRLGSARGLALANGHKRVRRPDRRLRGESSGSADARSRTMARRRRGGAPAAEIVERDALQTAALERRSRQLREAASQGDDVTLHTLLGEGADPNFRQRAVVSTAAATRATAAARGGAARRGHSTCVQPSSTPKHSSTHRRTPASPR